MTKDDAGDRHFEVAHLIDAALVATLVFFATILGGGLPNLLAGEVVYLSVSEILLRVPTAAIAFGLTFVFQWARARGIDVLAAYRRFKEGLP